MEAKIKGKSGEIYTLPLGDQERFLKILELNCQDFYCDTAGSCYPLDFHFEVIETTGLGITEAKNMIKELLASLDSRSFIS